MRRLLIWSLLALAPFTGVRMVCVDRPVESKAVSAAAGDCDEFCLRPTARAPQDAHGDIDCVLLADGAVLMVVSGVAVLPAQPAISFIVEALPYELNVTDFYLSPTLSHDSPPPKA
jgi:hypothetical protein